MLLNDFFFIKALTNDDGACRATIGLDPAHRIFEGHFPGQPVVPGVCMMMIAREVLRSCLAEKKLSLVRADHAKFLLPIDPRVNPEVTIELKYAAQENEEMKVTARLFQADATFFKYQAVFRIS